MKKLNYIFLSFILFSIFVNISCGDEFKHHDIEAPKISNIKFNEGNSIEVKDTIYYRDTIYDTVPVGAGERIDEIVVFDTVIPGTIFIDEIAEELKSDILVIGHKVWLSGDFKDDQRLSSIVVRVWGDTTPEKNPIQNQDTCFRMRKIPSLRMDTMEFIADKIMISDMIPTTMTSLNPHRDDNKKVLTIREGYEYQYSIHCSDITGNQDSIKNNIILFSESTIIKGWGKRK